MVNKETFKTDRLEADKTNQKQCLQAFYKLLTALNDFSKVPRTYKLSHINDDTDVIPKAESSRKGNLHTESFAFSPTIFSAILLHPF